MTVRPATTNDIPALKKLYEGTIKAVNARDYNAEQIAAWAATSENTNAVARRIETQYFIVAEINNVVVGFASIENGYLDLMYVHEHYQRQGVATGLFANLMQSAAAKTGKEITVHASITARPFFERQGFVVVHPNVTTIRGVEMTNYFMKLCSA